MGTDITFTTANSAYVVTEQVDGTYEVLRAPRGAVDAAAVAGEIGVEYADGFTATDVVTFNPWSEVKDDVAERRSVIFFLTDGTFVRTGAADEGALVFEAADRDRIEQLNDQAAERVRARQFVTV